MKIRKKTNYMNLVLQIEQTASNRFVRKTSIPVCHAVIFRFAATETIGRRPCHPILMFETNLMVTAFLVVLLCNFFAIKPIKYTNKEKYTLEMFGI